MQQKVHQMSDEELIKEIVKTNNSNLFAHLYDRYANVVYNKCLSFVKSKEEAQDLTHDIFIKLFLKLRSFKGNSKFSTWLYSFTYNFCVNYINRDKSKKFKTVSDDNIKDDVDENSLFELSDEELFQLKADKLEKAMELLNADDKMILLLKYQDELSIKELKEVLEVGESAVKMRLKRAKEKVVKIYQTL